MMENEKNFVQRWSLPTVMVVRGTYLIEKLPDGCVVRINIPLRHFASEEEAVNFVKDIQYKNI